MAEERVVLLDEGRKPAGTLAKSAVHTASTPLHLAFSLYVFDDAGRLLVTRRAVTKRTWPGVWTNTCCGHPAPGEEVSAAVRRRLREELGLELNGLAVALPDFAYRAVDAGGVVENEVCPVFVGRCNADPVADPAEVAEWRWVSWASYRIVAGTAPWALSPWSAEQVAELSRSVPPIRRS